MAKLSNNDINREGFAVLHGKWGGGNVRSVIGLNAKSEMRNPKFQIGYFAYPNPTLKNNIPDSRFYEFDELKTITHPRRRTNVCPPSVDGISFETSGKLEQSVTKSEYIKKIHQIKELLAAGEIYQMCYCIRFRKKFIGSPYALFLRLTEANPTDFSAYLNCGDFQIISNSPERFFKVEGNKIITQPIKGTIAKDSGIRKQKTENLNRLNPESCFLFPDKNLKKLLNSDKERAELDMITDLERNDVGKICKYGTLRLAKEREVLELKNLWHTYSQVEGKLESGLTPDQIIKAMFPGGSITGCPKKRAMEYIEELEGLPRNIFTGSVGYIQSGVRTPGESGFQMDFNIAIRTALVQNGYIEYWAGGGIVADSEPEKEYEECMLKAEKFLKLI
ncbi:anthranilate synthase component I family protein [Patescibacteria group bacterium]|nr:anthranilate synthase component I family protein [Patescibacteria group bacterium]MBU1683447.1 anthranilate synthase component I family protein [Patescibacteria group bacterium]MBU1934993.1 anthranilate synthase component I family protein [Patescibacteria group bacterium]